MLKPQELADFSRRHYHSQTLGAFSLMRDTCPNFCCVRQPSRWPCQLWQCDACKSLLCQISPIGDLRTLLSTAAAKSYWQRVTYKAIVGELQSSVRPQCHREHPQYRSQQIYRHSNGLGWLEEPGQRCAHSAARRHCALTIQLMAGALLRRRSLD